MVGILRVAKAGWLSGLNNLDVVQFLHFIAFDLNTVSRYIIRVNQATIQRHVCLRRQKYMRYMKGKRNCWQKRDRYAMATVVETCSLLSLQAFSFTLEDLRKWYNGYNSGDGERLYNPWSIAQAFKTNRLDCYWT